MNYKDKIPNHLSMERLMPEEAPKLDSHSIRRFRNLLLATATMVYLLIVIGGIVRVTGSGLGCPDWPRCFGQWIPPMRMDAIIEYSHRLVAALTSPLILASAVVAWWRLRKLRLVSRPLVLAAVLLAVQGLLGGVVVILETPPNLVAVHLGIAFLIQGLILLPAVFVSMSPEIELMPTSLSFRTPFERLVLHTLVVVFLMIVSGALVVGSNSTYACSGWPLCNGELIPDSANALIHLFHRFMVLLASLYVARLFLKARAGKFEVAAIRTTARIVAWLFLAQAAVGALKVSFEFPTWLLGLHVALAAAVWVIVVVLSALVGISEV